MFVKSAVIRFSLFLFYFISFFSCYCVGRLVQLVAWAENIQLHISYVRTCEI